MLSNISTYTGPIAPSVQCIQSESRYSRNEEEDLKKAITYLYEFKKKLDELHPNCLILIENMLQTKNRSHY